jgi:hypothetical protein
MSNLADRVRSTGQHLDAGYDARRTQTALDGLRTKIARRRTRRMALGSALGGLCVVAGLFAALRGGHGPMTATPDKGTLFTLSDGSVVMPLGSGSKVVAKSVMPQLVELDLMAGGAHFDVAPNPDRTFRVNAGRVRVVVVGTRFSVDRDGEWASVAVERGKVRVEWERGQQLLVAGERGHFPPVETHVAPAPGAGDETPAVEPEAPAERPTVETRGQAPRPSVDWRALANHGDFASAYRALHDKARPTPLNNVDDLLLAADIARKAGRPTEAPPYLEKALASHVTQARRAVVAFTLGRVRLADLDDPVGAAAAFALARAAAPQGPLAEDALAREIEARYRSGDHAEAHALAEEYLETWPAGAHLRAVRHFGGLP